MRGRILRAISRVLVYVFVCNGVSPLYGAVGEVDLSRNPQQKTEIIERESGADQIQLNAPSRGGVSKNYFKDYNVDSHGVILNNSVTDRESQLGGSVKANPNYRGQEAGVIVIEAVGNRESVISGPTEVVGRKADVIMANPNGIRIRNATMINVGNRKYFGGANREVYDDYLSTIEIDEDVQDEELPNDTGLNVAPNRVPVISISEASRGGVSKNWFKTFSVDEYGVVINNSLQEVESVLAGTIGGNQNLKGRSADVVLFEVTGKEESQLGGDVEMAGKSADFVLANESGIKVSGGQFINIPRVTLTTGVARLDGEGELDRIEVRRGVVEIGGGSGFVDGSDTDYFDVISRAAKLSGTILGGAKTQVIVGQNVVGYETGDIEVMEGGLASDRPLVAIDGKALGSMYAGSIRFVSTEAGVGVNSGGLLVSLMGDVEISSDGTVSYVGAMSEGGFRVLSGSGEVKQSGSVVSGAEALIAGKEGVDIAGNVIAGGDVVMVSEVGGVSVRDGMVVGGGVVIEAGDDVALNRVGVNSTRMVSVGSGGDVRIEQSDVAGGDVHIRGAGSIGVGETSIMTQGAVVAIGSDVEVVGSVVFAGKNATFLTDGSWVQRDSYVDGDQVLLVSNQAEILGDSRLMGFEGISIGSTGLVIGKNGRIESAYGGVGIETDRLDNEGVIVGSVAVIDAIGMDNRGSISGSKSVLVVSGDGVNTGDIAGENSVLFNADGDIRNSGVVVSMGGVEMAALGGISNSGILMGSDRVVATGARFFDHGSDGVVMSNGKVTLVTDQVLGVDGFISGGEVMLKGDRVSLGSVASMEDKGYRFGEVRSVGGGGIFVMASIFDPMGGRVMSSGDLVIYADVMRESGVLSSGGSSDLEGYVTSKGNLSLLYKGDHYLGEEANYTGDGVLTIGAVSIINRGVFSHDRDVVLESETYFLNDRDGQLAVNSLVVMAGGNVFNRGEMAIAGDAIFTVNQGSFLQENKMTVGGSLHVEASDRIGFEVAPIVALNEGLVRPEFSGKSPWVYPVPETTVGHNVMLVSGKDISMSGAVMDVGGGWVSMSGGGTFIHSVADSVYRQLDAWGAVSQELLSWVPQWQIKSSDRSVVRVAGGMTVLSEGDLEVLSSDLTVTGESRLESSGEIRLGDHQFREDLLYTLDNDHALFYQNAKQELKISHIALQDNVVMVSEKGIQLGVGTMSVDGDLSMRANTDIEISSDFEFERYLAQYINNWTERIVGSQLSVGGSAMIEAGGDMLIGASSVSVGDNLHIQLGGSLGVVSERELQDLKYFKATHTQTLEFKEIVIGSDIAVGGHLSVMTGEDILIKASDLSVGKTAYLASGGDVSFNEDYNLLDRLYRKRGAKKEFNYKQEHEEKKSQIPIKSVLMVGTSHTDEDLAQLAQDGQLSLIVRSEKGIEIGGSEIHVVGGGAISSKDSLVIRHAEGEVYTRYEKHGGGISSEKKGGQATGLSVLSSEVAMSGTIWLASEDVVYVGGSKVSAGEHLVIEGTNGVFVKSAKEVKESSSFKESNYVIAGESKNSYQLNVSHVGSVLESWGHLRVKSDGTILISASHLSAGGDIELVGKDVQILSEEESDYREESETSWWQEYSLNTTRSSIGVSSSYLSSTDTEVKSVVTHKESILQSGGAISILANGTAVIIGSELLAGGDLTVLGQDIHILTVKEVESLKANNENLALTRRSSIQNEFVETAYQAGDVIATLVHINEFDKKSGAEKGSSEAEFNKAAKILQVALLAAQIAQLVESTARSVASAKSYGFSSSTTIEGSSAVSESETLMKGSKGSVLYSDRGDIQIMADNNVMILGSLIDSKEGNLSIKGKHVDIRADDSSVSVIDRFRAHSASYGFGSSGAKTGVFSNTEMSHSLTNTMYTPSLVSAKNGRVSIESEGDIDVIGSVIMGRSIDIKAIDGQLTVRSLQDHLEDKYNQESISVGSRSGYSLGVSSTKQHWVNTQAKIIGSDEVKIHVGHLELEGGLIANMDEEGNDKGNLLINARTIRESTLLDSKTHYANSVGFFAGVSLEAKPKANSIQLNLANQRHEAEQAVRGTIGNGVIITDSDLTGLNRDTKHAMEMIKDKRSGGLNIDLNVDINAIKDPKAYFSSISRLHQTIPMAGKNLGYSAKVGLETLKNVFNDPKLLEAYQKHITTGDGHLGMSQNNPELVSRLNDPLAQSVGQLLSDSQEYADTITSTHGMSNVSVAFYSSDALEGDQLIGKNGERKDGYGFYDPDSGVIYINIAHESLISDPAQLTQTIYHEILHAQGASEEDATRSEAIAKLAYRTYFAGQTLSGKDDTESVSEYAGGYAEWYGKSLNSPLVIAGGVGAGEVAEVMPKMIVQVHEVKFGQYHASIMFKPENQELYAADSRFFVDESDGKIYTTLGAGPNWLLQLTSDFKRDSDMLQNNKVLKSEAIVPSHKEDEVFQTLEKLMATYNKSPIRYELFPPTYTEGGNSNSFISGILKSAKIQPPVLDENLSLPGYNKPVKETYFK